MSKPTVKKKIKTDLGRMLSRSLTLSIVITLLATTILPLWVGYNFNIFIVGDSIDTSQIVSDWSIIFGWQWIFVFLLTLISLVYSSIKGTKAAMMASLLSFILLIAILAPAAYVRKTHKYYAESEGGPTGPSFSCLVWENSKISGEYDGNPLGVNLCTLMSIPSYSRFLTGTTAQSDTEEGSRYTETALISELILIGAVAFLLFGFTLTDKLQDD